MAEEKEEANSDSNLIGFLTYSIDAKSAHTKRGKPATRAYV